MSADIDPCMVINGDAPSDVERKVDACAQCGATWPHDPSLPGCMTDEHGVRMMWCSDACVELWMAADPKRREGWVAIGELPPEVLREKLAEVGIELDGVGPRMSS